MYAKLDYDLERDFVPLIMVANVPQVLVVNPKKVPAANYAEFLAFVRKNPGKLNYGSAGGGTSHHLAGELFKLQTNTFITHIPYRGAGPALQDLIAGNVDMMFDGLGSSAAHIKGGRIKALMVSGTKRTPASPMCPVPPNWVCPTTPSAPGMASGRPKVHRLTSRGVRWRKSAAPARPMKPRPPGPTRAPISPTWLVRSSTASLKRNWPSGLRW
jgi:hypothetical protein